MLENSVVVARSFLGVAGAIPAVIVRARPAIFTAGCASSVTAAHASTEVFRSRAPTPIPNSTTETSAIPAIAGILRSPLACSIVIASGLFAFAATPVGRWAAVTLISASKRAAI